MNVKTASTQQSPKFKEAPRYRLLQKAFLNGVKVRKGKDWVPMDDVLLDPESMPLAAQLSGPHDGSGGERMPLEIEFLGIPDEHMEPLNDAARWMSEHIDEMKERARQQSLQKGKGKRDPIDALTIIGPGAAVLSPSKESV